MKQSFFFNSSKYLGTAKWVVRATRRWQEASMWGTILHTQNHLQNRRGCWMATCWHQPPDGACLCWLPPAAPTTHSSAQIWSSFVFSSVQMEWMQLFHSLKITNSAETVLQRPACLLMHLWHSSEWKANSALNKPQIQHIQNCSNQVK